VIVSNRSLDAGSMAVFRFDVEHGSLNLNHVQSTVGREPRDLVFTNNGTRVVVANQGSDTLVVFTFDEDTSHLERVSTVSVPAPVCLRVL
jgi:6-phosphogluconolactonase